MSSRLLTIGALLAALTFAGCGDDEPDASAGGTTVAPTTPVATTPVEPTPEEADDADPAPAEKSPTQSDAGDAGSEEWKVSVRAICTKNQQALMAQAQTMQGDLASATPKQQQDAAAKFIEASVKPMEKTLDRLRDVDVPGNIEGDYEKFIDRIEDGLDLFPKVADTLRTGKEDPSLNDDLQQMAKDTRPFATKHKLESCLANAS